MHAKPSANSKFERDEAVTYLQDLLVSLSTVAAESGCPELPSAPPESDGTFEVHDLQSAFHRWTALDERVALLENLIGNARNSRANIAAEFEDVAAFWEAVDLVDRGETDCTYWDTYEHGQRRRLEGALAKLYGSGDALLTNCGMSAIAVALGACRLRAGQTLVTGSRCYFETSGLLERFVEPIGVSVHRLDLSSPSVSSDPRLAGANVILAETVINAPDPAVLGNVRRWREAAPRASIIIDNSAQSHLTRWFDLLGADGRDLLVVESATKYLAAHCVAGVVYGEGPLMALARDHARDAGHQLQERAFNYITLPRLSVVGAKLALHSRNTACFAERLESRPDLFESVDSLSAHAERSEIGAEIFAQGQGCLVFITARVPAGRDVNDHHRQLTDGWADKLKARGLRMPVRAGFGWSQTCARLYEGSRLNQSDAPCYIRVSVGQEPQAVVEAFAEALIEVAQELSGANFPASAVGD